jgi:hypothetical protein
MTSVVSMYPFQGRLYVGSAGWYSTLLPSSELIRINSNDTWELIAGNVRLSPRGLVFPLSGLGDGFGNPFNAHIWRMEEHDGVLYAGSNDDSWALRSTPLAPYFRSEFGFDVFASTNGVAWSPVVRNGLGNMYNFGLRTFASTPVGLFLGTVNYVQGTEVWLASSDAVSKPATALASSFHATTRTPPSTPVSGGSPLVAPTVADERDGEGNAEVDAPRPPPIPEGVEAEALRGRAYVSWSPGSGAARYHVYRSTYRKTDLGFLLGFTPAAGEEDPMRPGEKPGVFSVPGGFVEIGTATDPVFEDRDVAPRRTYAYYVQAEDRNGKLSPPSNIRMIPDLGPPATFEGVRSELAALLAADRRLTKPLAGVTDLLDEGRTAAAGGDLATARARLDTIRERLTQARGVGPAPPPASPLDILIARLARRIDLILSGSLPSDVLKIGQGDDHDRTRPRAAPKRSRRQPTITSRPLTADR